MNGMIRSVTAKSLLTVLGKRLLSKKYAESRTRSSSINTSIKFTHLLVYGRTLEVITSISNEVNVKANCVVTQYELVQTHIIYHVHMHAMCS